MSKVKIQGNASGTGVLTVTAPNTSTDRTITLPDEDVTLGAATPSIDDNGDATAITIDSSENVGIGKTDPTAKLEISVTDTDSSPVNGTNIYKARSSHSLQISNVSDSATYSGIHLRTRSTGASAWSINNVHTSQYVGDLTFVTRTDTSSASERMRILSSGGITFNGDSAAANALDDYEEGTWTPTLTGSIAGSYTLDGGSNLLAYTKIGRVVHISGYINITNRNSENGNLRLTLPFTSFNGTDDTDYAFGNGMLANHGGNIPNGIHMFVTNNSSYVYMYNIADNGTASYIDHSDTDSAFQIGFSMTYIAA